tara:strand:- start:99 stop:290 length:192 start_codon:yes stop_codon:yes gene_type:complete
MNENKIIKDSIKELNKLSITMTAISSSLRVGYYNVEKEIDKLGKTYDELGVVIDNLCDIGDED